MLTSDESLINPKPIPEVHAAAARAAIRRELASDVAGGSSEVGSQPLPWRPTDGRLPRRVVRVTPSDRKRSRAARCSLFEICCGRRRDGRRCDEQTGGGGGFVARSTAPCVAPRWGREGHAAAACVCGDGAALGRRRAAGAWPSRAHRAARAALARVAAHTHARTHCTRVSSVCVICRAVQRAWSAVVGRVDVSHDHRGLTAGHFTFGWCSKMLTEKACAATKHNIT